jgi:chromosome segregation ATPase
MSDSGLNHHAFEAISKRISNALEELEAALERQRNIEHARQDLIDELVFLRQERQNLAQELEACRARCQNLEEARDEVLSRLEKASLKVKAILTFGLETGCGE